MGYDCTMEAMTTLNEIERQLITRYPYIQHLENAVKLDKPISNTWLKNNIIHVIEIGKTNWDGAITGSILRFCVNKDNSIGRYISRASFRIEPDGSIKRFPYMPKDVKAYIRGWLEAKKPAFYIDEPCSL